MLLYDLTVLLTQDWKDTAAGLQVQDGSRSRYEEVLSMNLAGLGRRMSKGGNEEDDDGAAKGAETEEDRWIRWLLATNDEGVAGGGHDVDDMVIGLTSYDTDAEPEPGIESVLIPNRSKNQYIRQTTSNGRKCVFQLDAYAAPKNSTMGGDAGDKKGSKEGPTIVGEDGKEEDRLKWIQGRILPQSHDNAE